VKPLGAAWVTPQRNRQSGVNKAWRPIAVVVLALALVTAFGVVGVGSLGHWLVLADSLKQSEAVVVLSGHLPFRAMEAAAIYNAGWAREVWITRAFLPAEEAAMARLGIEFVPEAIYNRQIVERLGVPHEAIRLLDKRVSNTAEEVHLIVEELERVNGKKVILVTSKSHTRRVRAIWRVLGGEVSEAIVRYSEDDPFDPARWWRNTRDALAVSREVFGMMNVWAGFPVRPDRR